MKQMNAGLSQESLKLIACITMLVDHIGAIFFPGIMGLRIIGRISFPLYCFLLVEGAHHTHDPKKYTLRLLFGALLAELPFDLAFSGGVDCSSCSVMVTLFFGYLSILVLRKGRGLLHFAVIGLICLLVEYLRTDYGAVGIAIILLFEVTRGIPRGKLWQLAGLSVLCWSGHAVPFGPFQIPIQLFAVFAILPTCIYTGRKVTRSKAVQWGFYLFYPVHLLILGLLK